MAGSGWNPVGVDALVTVTGNTATIAVGGSASLYGVRGLAGRSRGRRYFEVTGSGGAYASSVAAGFFDAAADLGPYSQLGGGDPIQGGWRPADGQFYYSYPGGDKGARTDGDNASAGVIGVMIDFDIKQCFIYLDGVLKHTELMNIPDDTVLYPGCGIYSAPLDSTAAELQTIEPFAYPPAISFSAWDMPDAALSTKISGILEISEVPASRTLKAFTYERLTYDVDGSPVQESKPLGQTVSDPETGAYEIVLRDGFSREIFVLAFDEYGNEFEADASIGVGDRIHPTTPNGYVYECDGSGILPSSEPVWSSDTSLSQAIGTASVRPFPFYRPQVHGPIVPEKVYGLWDPYWANVVSLLMFEGANDSVAFIDSTGKRSWTKHGSAKITTASSAMGDSSGDFSVAGSYIDTPDSNDFNFGAGDFTIEGFMRPNVSPITSWAAIYSQRISVVNSLACTVAITDIGQFWFTMSSGGNQSTSLNVNSQITPPANQWSHFAVSRVGNKIRSFVNGVGGPEVSCTGFVMFNSTAKASIGNFDQDIGNGTFPGKLDAIRITKGVGRYSDNFTPPTYYPEQ